MLEWSARSLVGLGAHGGVGRPHLGASDHVGASLCILTSEDVFLHLCFLVVWDVVRRQKLSFAGQI